MAKERTCMICGAKYKFCNQCKENAHEPGWKILYHDENCKKIGDLWYAYRGNAISKEDARKAMSQYKPNIDKALEYDKTVAAKEIKAIFEDDNIISNKPDIVNEDISEPTPEIETVEVQPVEEIIDEKPAKRNTRKRKYNKGIQDNQ